MLARLHYEAKTHRIRSISAAKKRGSEGSSSSNKASV